MRSKHRLDFGEKVVFLARMRSEQRLDFGEVIVFLARMRSKQRLGFDLNSHVDRFRLLISETIKY